MDHMIRTRSLTKLFGKGGTLIRAVEGIDLEVSSGELVLIQGPSGAGKTTLLTMLGGLLRPTTGEVWVGAQPLHALDERVLPRLRRQQIGFVFQAFNLIGELSALQNVLVVLNLDGRSGHDAHVRAESILIDLGLGDRLHALPDALSGGERQRVSIARALVNDPPVILADEPTANLDSTRGFEIMRQLREESDQGRAVLVVSHDERLQRFADRTLHMHDGRIEAQPTVGVPDESISEMLLDALAGRQRSFAGAARENRRDG